MLSLYNKRKTVSIGVILGGAILNASDVLNAVSTVGFPIVMCLLLLYVLYQQNEEHKEEMAKMNESLANNTLAIQRLTDILEGRDNEQSKVHGA